MAEAHGTEHLFKCRKWSSEHLDFTGEALLQGKVWVLVSSSFLHGAAGVFVRGKRLGSCSACSLLRSCSWKVGPASQVSHEHVMVLSHLFRSAGTSNQSPTGSGSNPRTPNELENLPKHYSSYLRTNIRFCPKSQCQVLIPISCEKSSC